MSNTKVKAGNILLTTPTASSNDVTPATTQYVTTALANLADSAPSTLNTLNELAAALGDDANYATTTTNAIATKLPLAGGTMTGDLILNDNIKVEIGSLSGGDLQLYHDGGNSYIRNNTGWLNMPMGGSGATFANSDFTKIIAKFIVDGANELYYDGSKKLYTNGSGIDIVGTAALTGGITVQDSQVAYFGTGLDLRIFHDGNHSVIQDLVGSGALKIKSNDTRLEDADGNNIIKATSTAAELYFSGAKKLETTAGGVVVTGSVATSAGGTFTTAAGNDLNIVYPASRSLFIKEGSETHLTIDNTGRVGINRTPAQANSKLEVGGADNVSIIMAEASGATAGIGVRGGGIGLYTGTTSHFMVNTSGAATLANTLTLTDGDIVLANGHGIDFSATSAVGSSELFDDYEEGTWTPIIAHNDGSGAIPLTVVSAVYTKIGRVVTVRGYLTAINPNGNAGTSSPYYGIRGFPYAPSGYTVWHMAYASGGITSYGGYMSSANMYFNNTSGNAPNGQAHISGTQFNAWGSNLVLMFSATYNIG